MSNDLKDIAAWASSVQQEIAEESAQITRQIFHSVIAKSPVETGRFLANWHIGQDANYSVPTTSTYAAKHAEIDYTITDDYFLRNSAAFITNNLDYAKQVEYEGWKKPRWSGKTGPYEPVIRTLAEFPPVD